MGFLDSLKNLFAGGSGHGRRGKGKKSLPRADISKRFTLRGKTGQGSMSKVYQAYDSQLGRTVCLKLLDKEKTSKFEERFKIQKLAKPSEGEICMGLRHTNIVDTYEHGLTHTGDPYLVMEWIEGLGMNYLIETNSPQLKGNRVNYLLQLVDAVGYLHGQRYLHRDLCPRNIMVTNAGVVKLIDFGLTIPYTPEFCRPGNRTGTADYLAPEIIKRMTTDHRVDVFALGVTAYEIFTGQMPWERALTSEETLRRHLNVAPRHPKELNRDLDDQLCALLLKTVERDPRLRFSSAMALKEAIQGLSRKDY